jgi:transcriptional regulator of acetoin/glycerol metabolism
VRLSPRKTDGFERFVDSLVGNRAGIADLVDETVRLRFRVMELEFVHPDRAFLVGVMNRHRWSVYAAAKRLGIKRSTLQYRLRKYGLRACDMEPAGESTG